MSFKREIPQEYLLVKTSSAAKSHRVTDNCVLPKQTLCTEGLFLSALLLTGLSISWLPSFYFPTGCNYLTSSISLETLHVGVLGTEGASLDKTVPKCRNKLGAGPHFTERWSHFQWHITCRNGFLLQLHSQGAVGKMTCCHAGKWTLAAAWQELGVLPDTQRPGKQPPTQHKQDFLQLSLPRREVQLLRMEP